MGNGTLSQETKKGRKVAIVSEVKLIRAQYVVREGGVKGPILKEFGDAKPELIALILQYISEEGFELIRHTDFGRSFPLKILGWRRADLFMLDEARVVDYLYYIHPRMNDYMMVRHIPNAIWYTGKETRVPHHFTIHSNDFLGSQYTTTSEEEAYAILTKEIRQENIKGYL